MPISVDCPACLEPLSIPDEYARGAVRCPKCKCLIPPTSPGAPLPSPIPTSAGATPAGLRLLSSQRFTCGACKEAITPDQPALFCSGPTRHKVHTNCAEVLCGGKCPECGFALGAATVPAQSPAPVSPPRAPHESSTPPSTNESVVGAVIGTCVFFLLIGCCGLGMLGTFKGPKVTSAAAIKSQVTATGYAVLDVGSVTQSDAQAVLGPGRVATEADLAKTFPGEAGRADAWAQKVNAKRVIVWQNGDDYLFAAFYPSPGGTGRLQAKEWRPKFGAAQRAGELDDAMFLRRYPALGSMAGSSAR